MWRAKYRTVGDETTTGFGANFPARLLHSAGHHSFCAKSVGSYARAPTLLSVFYPVTLAIFRVTVPCLRRCARPLERIRGIKRGFAGGRNVVERSERYASVAKPDEPRSLPRIKPVKTRSAGRLLAACTNCAFQTIGRRRPEARRRYGTQIPTVFFPNLALCIFYSSGNHYLK